MFIMKLTMTKLLSFLLLAVFTLSSAPAFAIAATSTVGTSIQSTETYASAHVAKQKTEKRGFFAKLKNFGQKTKMFFKALAAGSDHNAVIAILLAFFLGGLGLHRVYLGGRPILILLYIITFGGIFGILPLIDFIRLIIGQMDHYEGNDKFFAAFS